MKSKFFLVQTDVFLSICIILIINSMQSMAVFSANHVRAGQSSSPGRALEIRVAESGALNVTSGDTTCEQALIFIHPSAPAGSYELQLNDVLSNSNVKSVARVLSQPPVYNSNIK